MCNEEITPFSAKFHRPAPCQMVVTFKMGMVCTHSLFFLLALGVYTCFCDRESNRGIQRVRLCKLISPPRHLSTVYEKVVGWGGLGCVGGVSLGRQQKRPTRILQKGVSEVKMES